MNDNLFSILFIFSLIVFFVVGSFIAKLFHLESYIYDRMNRSDGKDSKKNVLKGSRSIMIKRQ